MNPLAGMEITNARFTFQLNPNNFPRKLWHLVNDPQLYSICWDDRGERILIHQERFEVEVLFSHDGEINRYFNTRDFNSFIRQLNLYGFRKVRRSLDGLDRAVFTAQMHRFHNPNFKRDKPELLVNLKRLRPVKYPRLAVSTEVPDMITGRFHYPMLNSPQENSEGMKSGSVFSLEHQETPYHHYTNGSQQVRECDRTPNPSQAFVMGHGDLGVDFPHILMDSPSAYPFSTMSMQQSSQSTVPAGNSTAVISHHSDYRLYTPVYQWYNPESFDMNTPCSQQPAPSYVHCTRYYTDYSVSYLHWTNPNCQAGDAPEAKESGVNLDMVFKIADEMQAVSSFNPVTNEKQSPEKEETPRFKCND